MRRMSVGLALGFLFSSAANATMIASNVSVAGKLAECGDHYDGPIGEKADEGRRACSPHQDRKYKSKYNGIGKSALDLESQACFVPDASYRLLDSIIDEVRARAKSEGLQLKSANRRLFMERISALTGKVLEDQGFELWIPTETLANALHPRQAAGELPRFIFDCDTGALILLEVAASYGLSASLVEMTLQSGAAHNYVRWHVDADESFEWDTNARGVCKTPPNLPHFEGRSMTRNEVKAYLLTLRVPDWKNQSRLDMALADYREAIRLGPKRPMPYNNAAWMIATRNFPGRGKHKQFALDAAKRAVAIHPTPNLKDTLACAYALNGNFAEAVRVQREVLAELPKDEFAKRLALFEAETPQDCIGQI